MFCKIGYVCFLCTKHTTWCTIVYKILYESKSIIGLIVNVSTELTTNIPGGAVTRLSWRRATERPPRTWLGKAYRSRGSSWGTTIGWASSWPTHRRTGRGAADCRWLSVALVPTGFGFRRRWGGTAPVAAGEAVKSREETRDPRAQGFVAWKNVRLVTGLMPETGSGTWRRRS